MNYYQAALKYENVVRFKGGDPLYLEREEKKLDICGGGIKFEIIQGIT